MDNAYTDFTTYIQILVELFWCMYKLTIYHVPLLSSTARSKTLRLCDVLYLAIEACLGDLYKKKLFLSQGAFQSLVLCFLFYFRMIITVLLRSWVSLLNLKYLCWRTFKHFYVPTAIFVKIKAPLILTNEKVLYYWCENNIFVLDFNANISAY